MKYKVPKEMLTAAAENWSNVYGHGSHHGELQTVLEAAIRWLSENQIVPETGFGTKVIYTLGGYRDAGEWIELGIKEWQRRMFLAPEPEVPEEIKDLLLPDIESGFFKPEIVNERLREAYRRGRSGNREESAYMRVTKAMGAVTLTREEGDRIIEYVRGAIHDAPSPSSNRQ